MSMTDMALPASISAFRSRPGIIACAQGGAPECKSIRRLPDGPPLATDPVDPVAQARCRIVLDVVEELVMLVGERTPLRRDRRRALTHVRQIAMYVSHVVLQVSLTDIGIVLGRDRTTVAYACHVVEDRRDDADFDAFITAVERVVTAVFPASRERADA